MEKCWLWAIQIYYKRDQVIVKSNNVKCRWSEVKSSGAKWCIGEAT